MQRLAQELSNEQNTNRRAKWTCVPVTTPVLVFSEKKMIPCLPMCPLLVLQMTDKAISDIRNRPGRDETAGGGSAGGVWGANGSAPGSGSSAGGGEAGDGEDGPHTV